MKKRMLAPLALLLLPLVAMADEQNGAAQVDTAAPAAVVADTVVAEKVAAEKVAAEKVAAEKVAAEKVPVVDNAAVETAAVKAVSSEDESSAITAVAADAKVNGPVATKSADPVAEQAQGLNTDLAPVYKMPAWVERVESFCPWKSKDGEGYVRVVRTERHGRHQLFLQWIKKGGTTGTDSVLSTRSVEELEKDYIVRLEMPKALLNPKSCELTTMADSLNNSQRFRFKVILREPGNYMLQVTQVLGTAEI